MGSFQLDYTGRNLKPEGRGVRRTALGEGTHSPQEKKKKKNFNVWACI